jgi:dCTP deaminase
MVFWSQERVEIEGTKVDLIDGFDPSNLENGAYALRVADEYAITTANGGGEKRTVHKGEHIKIPPGQFALLLTKESISIPDSAIGFISIKSKPKLRGLINVSGFHVDPGFSGHLKFSVYNAGNQSLEFEPGQKLFLLWFSELDQKTKYVYKGDRQNQKGITPDDVSSIKGMVGSPAGLNARMDALETRLTTDLEAARHQILSKMITTVLIPIMIGLVLVVVTAILVPVLLRDGQRPAAPQQATPSSTVAP